MRSPRRCAEAQLLPGWVEVDVERVFANVDADALSGDRAHRRCSALVMRARGPSDCPACGTSERAGSGLTRGLEDQGCRSGLPPAVRSTGVPVYRTPPSYKVDVVRAADSVGSVSERAVVDQELLIVGQGRVGQGLVILIVLDRPSRDRRDIRNGPPASSSAAGPNGPPTDPARDRSPSPPRAADEARIASKAAPTIRHGRIARHFRRAESDAHNPRAG